MCDTADMIGIIRNVVLAVLAVVAGLVSVFLVGMRRKSPPVVDAVRRFNKAVSNPKQMATVGTPGAYASIIEHVGRRSGATYRTPIGTQAVPDGFLVTLPYGTRADWVQNVLAAGQAVVTARRGDRAGRPPRDPVGSRCRRSASPERAAAPQAVQRRTVPAPETGERRGLTPADEASIRWITGPPRAPP